MTVLVYQPAVMSGGNTGTSGTVRPLAEYPFLEEGITQYTGVRSPPPHVFLDEITDDDLPEFFAYVGYMVFDAQPAGK